MAHITDLDLPNIEELLAGEVSIDIGYKYPIGEVAVATDQHQALAMLRRRDTESLANRIANCIALCCVVSWRISWLTMLRRQFPTASPAAVFTDTERALLDRSMPSNSQSAPHDMAFYMTAVARLGGYLNRSSDGPPGTTALWRGFTRLADLVDGFQAANLSASSTCG